MVASFVSLAADDKRQRKTAVAIARISLASCRPTEESRADDELEPVRRNGTEFPFEKVSLSLLVVVGMSVSREVH